MGAEKARAFAKQLNLKTPPGPLVFFGSAGALRPHFQAGDVLGISHLRAESAWVDMPQTPLLQDLSQARLTSIDYLATKPHEKKKIGEETGADLVDQEMLGIWTELRSDLRERTSFVRIVIDELDNDISFLTNEGVLWSQLWQPSKAFGFLKFIQKWRTYSRETEKFLKKCVN